MNDRLPAARTLAAVDSVYSSAGGIQAPPRGLGVAGASRGDAGAALRRRELRRVFAFLVAGGVSAAATLTLTSLLMVLARIPFILAAIPSTELGILINFSINDRHAFRDLLGHRRPLPIRLVRFHLTCAFGQSLILALSVLMHDAARWPPLFAQALPIGLVTGINFAAHRFWTYRGSRKHAP